VWEPTGLAQGHPGLALAFAQLDGCCPGEEWDAAARRQIELAVEALRVERRSDVSLFSGLAGIAFAAESVDSRRYARLLSTLDALISQHTERAIARMESRPSGVAEYDLDVVSGLAGVGAYALTRGDEQLLHSIVDALVRIVLVDGDIPGWHTPPELLLDETDRAASPGGRLNCGLAHGIPGPLALLSLAASAGFDGDGLADSITRGATWLADQRVDDRWGVNWPYSVPIDGDGTLAPARAAWCYGAPGISRALWLAGEATGDRELQVLAVEALEAVARRPPEARQASAPTFCHGTAGILAIASRMADDCGSRAVCELADELAVSLVGQFEPEAIFGYRDLDADGRAVDRAGVLQGAAGVALVLLASTPEAAPPWERMFLVG
jgi:lantibiotic biosynthesis protein